MLRTEEEKRRGYSDATHALLLEIERVNLRQEPVFDVPEITRILEECYAICDLPMPRIETRKDIHDRKFSRAARTVLATKVSWVSWAARVKRAKIAARSACVAWPTLTPQAARAEFGGGAAWVAGDVLAEGASIDYDFDSFVMEHELLQHEAGTDSDRKALRLYSLFFEAKKAGLGYFIENDGILYIVPNPILKIDDRNRFHCEDGPAIRWNGGAEFYLLHGVFMDKDLVLTPADQIDPGRVWKLKNTDQRAQVIAKIGVGWLLDGPNARVLDGMGEYTLHEIVIGNNMRIRALKMRNQTERWKWHVEVVPPECSTVREARHARKPFVLRAIPISEDGEEWYQQGDVCIWPEGAKAVREFPSLLT